MGISLTVAGKIVEFLQVHPADKQFELLARCRSIRKIFSEGYQSLTRNNQIESLEDLDPETKMEYWQLSGQFLKDQNERVEHCRAIVTLSYFIYQS